MYELILKAPLKYPDYISKDGQDLLDKLLERDETKRLGTKKDFDEIKVHPFFDDIDWEALFNRKVEPPFVPQLKDDGDHQYFDTEFTGEQVKNSFAMKIADDEDDFGEFDFNSEQSEDKK